MADRTAQLIELIYSGLEVPSAWKSFLELFLPELQLSTAVLSIHYPSNPELSITVYAGKDDAYWQEIPKWVDQEPWLSRVPLSTLRPGELRLSHHICPDDELEATQIYREFLAPHDVQYGGGLVLSPGASQFATMSVLRPKSKGPLTEAECGFWLELGSHLVRATRLHEAQAKAGVERELLLSTPEPAVRPALSGRPVVIRIIDPAAGRGVDAEPLRQLFGLSEAEARLVSMLAQGLRIKDAAEALHVSVNTARTHLARALDKTATTNQGQLISLVMRTAPPSRET